MNFHAAQAVFKRNFFAYFSSPTGYVFICVFVLLCAFSAFWPAEFFNMNLANLGQLNKIYPFIMLLFIPAITMSVWAEERQRGTDELLLTLPARDFDITVGKFLAAIGIYSVSLLFAAICLLCELEWLGNPDLGLFIATFIGYWLLGVTMCAIGMAASFVTSNLTMAYIFGVAFNAPLTFAVWSSNLFSQNWGRLFADWSYSGQFAPFGRGLFSLSSTIFFVGCAAAALYVCMILISRRHWADGANARGRAINYTVRAVCLFVIVVGLAGLFKSCDLQLDLTEERLNSMAPETKRLIDSIEPTRPVKIDAYISPDVPQRYVQSKGQMERLLHEISSRGGKRFDVNIHYIKPLTDEALLAEKQYGIRPKRVAEISRSIMTTEDIYLAVVFSSGVEQVIIPYIDPGMSVDYELSRALATVSKKQRKRIGVVQTDVQLFSGIDFAAMRPSPDWKIIEELKLTYNVESVDPKEKINPADWDALLCVQPSSLGPDEMKNFIEAVEAGTPTAIFEDPLSYFAADTIPGTSEPRFPQGNPMLAMMMQQQAPPKGDITQLWDLLGVEFDGNGCVYQAYNPIPRFSEIPAFFIFIDQGAGEPQPFNGSTAATQWLQRVLLPFPGSIALMDNVKKNAGETGRNLEQSFLLRTGPKAGFVPGEKLFKINRMGSRAGIDLNAKPNPSHGDLIVSAWIKGKNWKRPVAEAAAADKSDKDAADKPAEKKPTVRDNVNVILTADLDLIHDAFFSLRNEVLDEDFKFDNVAFVLNVIDLVAGDESFCRIRSHRPEHRTLTLINKLTRQAREKKEKDVAALQAQYDKNVENQKKRIEEETQKLNRQIREQGLDQQEVLQRVELFSADLNKRFEAQKQQFERDKEQQTQRLETELRTEINRAQDKCKLLAVILPPILPLIIAIAVYIKRRLDEYEGVSKKRRRKTSVTQN